MTVTGEDDAMFKSEGERWLWGSTTMVVRMV